MADHARRGPRRPPLSAAARRNRADWEREAVAYERRHGTGLGRSGGMVWGLWHLPESRLGVLDEVRGKDVLELGCGAARWSVALAGRGARVTGLDVSPRRLAQARAVAERAHARVRFLEASAEAVPLPDESFDLIFCDWGAMTFCDPYRTVPEAARLLRPGGLFAFSNASPLRSICLDRRRDRIGRTIRYDYFGLHRIDYPEGVEFQLTYADWVRLFLASGLRLEGLLETRPPVGARSRYLRLRQDDWGRRFPLEVIWKLRKPAEPAARARPSKS